MRPEVKTLRKNVYDFINADILKTNIPAPVLEIGPMCQEFTPIKEYFVDTKAYFNQKHIPYKTCDIYPESGCDIIDDVLNLEKHIVPKSLGSIIALEVLEHTSKVWLVPDIFYNLLKPNGKIFISVPYHFYKHAPFPDFWRISDDGLKCLFGDKFDCSIRACYERDKNGNIIDDRKPIDFTLVGIKKAKENAR